MKLTMKGASAFLGFTGSMPVLVYSLALLFLRREILPSSGGVTGFDPDSLILFVSGLLGLFGSFIGIAGSSLSYYSIYAKNHRVFGADTVELSGIMLIGAAVSGAVMFAGLSALFTLVYIARLNRYVTLATGMIAFTLLAISGVISLAARRKPEGEPGR